MFGIFINNYYIYTMKAITSHLQFHLVFCTKYRRHVLVGDIEQRLKEVLLEVHPSIKIPNLEVMPDHVHIFLDLTDCKLPIHSAVSKIKGKTASVLRKEFSELRSRLPCLWTRSYYIGSVGSVSKDVVEKYINNQKNV